MKILSTKQNSKMPGIRTVTVELVGDEELMAIRPTGMYRLGDPSNDVVPAHYIDSARRVVWCGLEQKWIDA